MHVSALLSSFLSNCKIILASNSCFSYNIITGRNRNTYQKEVIVIPDFDANFLGLLELRSFRDTSGLVASLKKFQEQFVSSGLKEETDAVISSLGELSEATALFRDFDKQITESLRPLQKFVVSYNSEIQNSIKQQFKIFDSISLDDFYIPLSSESSSEFTKISDEILNDINYASVSCDANLSKDSSCEAMNPVKKITWQDVLLIISTIITILSFVQDSLPDKRVSDIEKHLEQLVDIQTKELELLQQLSE